MRYDTALPRSGQRDPHAHDSLATLKRLGIARELIAEGAHLVGCRPDKSPIAPGSTWKNRKTSNKAALAAIERGNPYGIVPGTPEAVESPGWPASVVEVIGYGIYQDDAYSDGDGAAQWIQRLYELTECGDGGGPWH